MKCFDAFRASQKIFERCGTLPNLFRSKLRSQAIRRNKPEGHTIRRRDFRIENRNLTDFLVFTMNFLPDFDLK